MRSKIVLGGLAVFVLLAGALVVVAPWDGDEEDQSTTRRGTLPTADQLRAKPPARFADDPSERNREQEEEEEAEGARRPVFAPAARYLSAQAEIERMLDGTRPDIPIPGADEEWESLGPTNMGGRTRAFAIDPDTPDVMYAGAVAGGMWKTTDGGASWVPLTDSLSNVAIASLDMDPSNPSVLYAGTGEGLDYRPARGAGIMKTSDAGATWEFLEGTDNEDFFFVNGVQVSPHDPNTLYAATSTGVWVTNNGGETWDKTIDAIREDGCSDVVVLDDTEPDIVFASCGPNTGQGTYRSDDGGQTWDVIFTEVDDDPVGRIAIAAAPSDESIVYASVAQPAYTQEGAKALGLFRSDQGGAPGTWNLVNDAADVPDRPNWLASCGKGGQGSYDHAIAVDPTDPNRLWLAGTGLFRSEDGGVTIRQADYYWEPYWEELDEDLAPYVHGDDHVFMFHPDYDGTTETRAFVTNDGGIYEVLDDRAEIPFNPEDPIGCDFLVPKDLVGENPMLYRDLNNGYGTIQFYGGAVSADGTILVGGAQDNASPIAVDDMIPDGWMWIHNGDGAPSVINEQRGLLFLQMQFRGLVSTGDWGYTYQDATNGITDTASFICPVVQDPSDEDVMWTGGQKMWRTTDAAGEWIRVSEDLEPLNQANVVAIGVAPSDSNIVYAGTESGRVFRSENALSDAPTWQSVSSLETEGDVTYITIDPVDPDVVYVSVYGFDINNVFRTTDGGVTWDAIDGTDPEASIVNVPVHTIAVNPSNTDVIFVGTDTGVFSSSDRGETWHVANDNLVSTVVRHLVFRKGTTDLYAFTYGRGLYHVDVGA